MSAAEQDLIVTVAGAHASRAVCAFRWGEAVATFSVGGQADWVVSAPGVAGVHLLLMFDGRELYAASAGIATAFLEHQTLGREWTRVPPRSELRLGEARLQVSSQPKARALPAEHAAPVRLPSYFVEMVGGVSKGDRSRALPGARESSAERARGRDPSRSTTGSRTRETSAARWLMWVLGALPVVVVTSAIAWYLASKHPTAEPATSGASATPAAKAAPRAAASAQSAPAVLDLEPARALAGAPELARAPAPASAALQRADTDPLFAPGSGDATPHRAYPQNVADRPIPRIGEEPWLVSDEWRTHHERLLQAPNRARAEVVFLGDSITEGWQMTPAYRERFGKYSPLDLGIAGDHTQHLLWRIEQGELDGIQPAVAVVMIGVNNLAGGFTPENTAAGVRAVVRAVRTHLPAASVLVLAVLPARHEPDDPLRHKINDTNRLLAGLAEPGKVSVHDVGSVFLDADGTISKSVMRDFLHPTGAGYALLSDAVAPLIEGALASRPKQ